MREWRSLITGGSGFIGTNLVEHLVRQGASVLNVDSVPPRDHSHTAAWRRVDLRDAIAVRRAVEEFAPTHVFHLAARTDLRGRSAADYDSNTEGTDNLLRSLGNVQDLDRVVIASTRLVNPIDVQVDDDLDMQPQTLYGASKAEMEKRVRGSDHELPWVIARPTSIWGPWFGEPYLRFFRLAMRGRYVHPRGVRVRKTFGFVANCVEQLMTLAAAPRDDVVGRTFYLGDTPPLDVFEWAQEIASASEGRSIREVPLGMFRVMARLGDMSARIGVSAPMTSYRLRNLTTSTVFAVSSPSDVGAETIDMREGVRRTVGWMTSTGAA